MKNNHASRYSNSSRHFSASSTYPQTYLKTVHGAIKAAITVFYVRAPYHGRVAKKLKYKPQKTCLPLNEELRAINTLLRSEAKYTKHKTLTQRELLGIMGVLAQFTDVLPTLRPYMATNYSAIKMLHDQIVITGKKSPLGFAEQLHIALKLTNGDLIEAIWRLFVVTRLYARWFDVASIKNVPLLTEDQIIDNMCSWYRSLRAVKQYTGDGYQDAAGDVYYCWTHALGKILYYYLPKNKNMLTKLEGFALEHGTWLNHTFAHALKPQSTPNNHSIAAKYGNAIGDLCVDALTKQSTEKAQQKVRGSRD